MKYVFMIFFFLFFSIGSYFRLYISGWDTKKAILLVLIGDIVMLISYFFFPANTNINTRFGF